MRTIKQYWHKALARINKQFALPQARELERKLSAVKDGNQTLLLELQGVHNELEIIRNRDETQLADLQQRIDHIESERDATRQQVQAIQKSLEEALVKAYFRQESTEKQVNLLDRKLEKERKKNQTELQEAHIQVRKQKRRLNWAMIVVGFALLLVTVASVTKIWDVRKNSQMLAEVSRDIKDIKFSMEQYLIDNLQEPPGANTATLPDEAADSEKFQIKATLPRKDELDPAELLVGMEDWQTDPLIPEYAFDYAEYLSRQQHDKKRTKAEMLAYFEENARQEGVISMPSGLQYKVLKRGSGRSPKASDMVLVDYRTFLPNETELYSTYDEEEAATFGLDEVSPGLREALTHMEVGAVWELHIPPALAYRGGTRRQGIFDFEPIIYIVELISIIEEGTSDEP